MPDFRIVCISLSVFLVISCSNQTVFRESYSFQDHAWEKDETVQFQVKISDTKSNYSVKVSLTHDLSYEYTKLMFQLFILTPDGAERGKTFELTLKDDKRNFTGNISGETVVVETEGIAKINFSTPGMYIFSFQHFMPFATVRGLRELNMEIVKLQD
jgi:gliding motility-associated lipoprotein GldH